MRADIADLFTAEELGTFEFVSALAAADAYYGRRRLLAQFAFVPLIVVPKHFGLYSSIVVS